MTFTIQKRIEEDFRRWMKKRTKEMMKNVTTNNLTLLKFANSLYIKETIATYCVKLLWIIETEYENFIKMTSYYQN